MTAKPAAPVIAPDFRKAAPHSLETERAMLGGLINDPRRIDDVKTLVSPEDCYAPHHERLLHLLLERHAAGSPIDMVVIPEEVMRLGADRFGGIAYVVQLGDRAISANADHYARAIRSDAVRRRLIVAADRIRERAYSATEDVPSLLTDAAAEVMALGTQTAGRSWRSINEVADSLLVRREKAKESGGAATLTFFDGLDRILHGGLHPGRVYVLAARPAMGKTALALQFAAACSWGGRTAGLFSMEMDGEENVDRWLRSYGEREVRGWSIHIDDTPGLSIGDIVARARHLKHRCESTGTPLGMLGIDYLQLVTVETRRGGTRAEAIGEVSRSIKNLARSLAVPIVLLAQVNRDCEKRTDKRPQVSDLKESGSIEQDADAVLLLYRDSVYSGAEAQEWDPVELLVGKNRQGPSAVMVPLRFNGSRMRFADGDDESPHSSGMGANDDRL